MNKIFKVFLEVMSDNSKIGIYVALHSIDPPENSIV